MDMHLLLTAPIERLSSVIQECLHPIYLPRLLQPGAACMAQPVWRLPLSHQNWGAIGSLDLTAQSSHQTILRFQGAEPPALDDIARLETPVRQRLQTESASYQLADFNNAQEQIENLMVEALQRYRQETLLQTAAWLLRRLRIYGLHLPGPLGEREAPDHNLGMLLGMAAPLAAEVQTGFELFLQGSPAEFGHLAQRFADLRGGPFACQVQAPGGKPGVWGAEVVSLEVRFSYDRRALIAQANSLPGGGSLLTVHLENREDAWQVWDLLCEELERLGMLRLPAFEWGNPAPVSTVDARPDLPAWQRVPVTTNRRLILQLWHEGHTAREIGQRINRSWKTVDNELSRMRAEFGEEVAPLRREKGPKESRK